MSLVAALLTRLVAAAGVRSMAWEHVTAITATATRVSH